MLTKRTKTSSYHQEKEELQSELQQESESEVVKEKRINKTKANNFVCKCGKGYGSIHAWHLHFKNKHVKGQKLNKQERKALEDQFYPQQAKKMKKQISSLHQSNESNQIIPQNSSHENRIIRTDDIKNNHQQADHKLKTDFIFCDICEKWQQYKKKLKLPRLQQHLYDPAVDQLIGDQPITSLQDIAKTRKQMMFAKVKQLQQEFRLSELNMLTYDKVQFRDYEFKQKRGIYSLNFVWDIIKQYKVEFSAYLYLYLQILVSQRQFCLNYSSTKAWQQFKQEKNWNRYGFVEKILSDYHRQWKLNDWTNITFLNEGI